jgi:HNH endonuclease
MFICDEPVQKKAPAARSCSACGSMFERTYNAEKYCGDDCRVRKAICAQCGTQFSVRYPQAGRDFLCSLRCSRLWGTTQRSCRGCKRQFDAAKAHYYCEACRHKACQVCGNMFLPGRRSQNAVECSVACKDAALADRECAYCLKRFSPHLRGQQHCSERCTNRTHEKIRRARFKETFVERVSPIRVFRRDKWKCQGCGIRTPERLYGKLVLNAPTLDHIKPINIGGEHSYRNAQLLCLRCNSRKQDKYIGQLRLF